MQNKKLHNMKWTCEKKKHRMLLLLSTIISFFVISPASLLELGVHFLLGIIIGIYVSFCYEERYLTKSIFIVCLAISLYIAYSLSDIFFLTWQPSSKAKAIIESFSRNKDAALRVISIVIAFFSLPFIFFIVSRSIVVLISRLKNINYKLIYQNIFSHNNRIFKRILVIFLNLLLAAGLGTVLLISVYSIPIDKIESNVKSSAKTISNEGKYPHLFSWCQSQLDNFTDSIMLLEAADNTENSIINKAMLAYRGAIGKRTPDQVLVAHYKYGTEFRSISKYGRYWHGYQIFLKPLLTIMDYSSIRILNGIFQILFFLALCSLMIERGLKKYLIPYILSYLMLMPIALIKSMQFSSCYYVYTIGTIIILLTPIEKTRKKLYLIFLNIGIATAFFDFLTYPIITFGIPVTFCLALERNDSTEVKIADVVKYGISWCLGYGGMWIAKWIVASIVTEENIVQNAFSAFIARTSNIAPDGITKYSRFKCIADNYHAFLRTPIVWIAILFVLVSLFINRKTKSTYPKKHDCICYFLISFLPVAWYIFTTNHSSIHWWFTNKSCVVSIISILFWYTEQNIYSDKTNKIMQKSKSTTSIF